MVLLVTSHHISSNTKIITKCHYSLSAEGNKKRVHVCLLQYHDVPHASSSGAMPPIQPLHWPRP